VSRIDDAFRRIREEKRTGLVTYVTAGDPSLAVTGDILKRLDAAGADVLEVGVPFSDPLADGPVIQRATERALAAGATLAGVLDMLAAVRKDIRAPIIIFSYANPILRMGIDTFVARAQAAGVDGVLTLDVPPEEAEDLRGRFQSGD
jgi:tryptophan synthase alpha chain